MVGGMENSLRIIRSVLDGYDILCFSVIRVECQKQTGPGLLPTALSYANLTRVPVHLW